MKKKILIIVIIQSILLSTYFSGDVFSQSEVSQSAIALKLEVERNVKSQIEHLLNNLVGQNKYSILVNAVVTTETITQKKKVYVPKKAPEEKRSFLPGIPLPKRGGEEETILKDETIDEVVKQPKISKILITIFLATNVEAGMEDKIKDAISNLSTTPQGGEIVLDIKRASFKTSITEFITNQQLLIIVGIILTFALIIFLFGPVRGFMRNFLRTLQEGKGREISVEMGGGGIGGTSSGGMQGGGILTSTSSPLALGPGKGSSSVTDIIPGEIIDEGIVVEDEGKRRVIKPFSFVRKSNLQNLVYLVQGEPPEIISLILSYLESEEAAEVMSSLPTELQGKVALAMATVKQASSESVIRAEENIKKRIDFLVGGLERFIGIMDRLDTETREEILSALTEENPTVAERVRKEIFTFDSIVDLDNSALQIILREVRTDSLAKALKDADEEVISKVMKNISAGASTLLKEEMELNVNVSVSQIDEERRKVIGIIRKMEKDGKITIKKEKKKPEKVFKIEKLEAMEENKEPKGEETVLGTRKLHESAEEKKEVIKEEKLFTKALSKEIESTVERKVSLKDFESKKEREISIAEVFGDLDWGKVNEKEKVTVDGSGREKQKEIAEELFTGKKTDKNQTQSEVNIGISQKTDEYKIEDKNKALEHYKTGIKKYTEKKFDEAIVEFLESIRYNNNLWQTYLCLGHCYRAKKITDDMVKAYRKSLELNPNNKELKDWLKQYEEKVKVA